jgi:aminoglycoside 3-N-acetyltransferase I
MKTVEIRILYSNEAERFNELIKVFETAFEMEEFKKPSSEHLQKLLSNENFVVIVALNGNKVIAGLTIYLLCQYYSVKPLAYLYDIAVSNEYQRKGIGKALVKFAKDYCKKNEIDQIFVQADIDDDYAIDFYRLTEPSTEGEFIQFSYLLTNYSNE